MSQKFGNYCSVACILTLLALFFAIAACDPCRQLAEEICQCSASEQVQKSCLNNLNLAHDHLYFKNATKPEVCEKALKECSCQQLNNKKDDKCGMYRLIGTR